jgi:serine/threonine-protein kinase
LTDLTSQLKAALADRYAVERELGRGGMATVYLARDLRHDRPVALKVLHPELAATLGPERFVREIRLAARLQHAHILSVHDSGATAGQLWFTMPFVEGESLRQLLTRERQLTLDVALRVVNDIAAALDYAHQHGVVHRDVKPENILLASGQAVLADFGVARAIDAAGGDRLTATGLALGTPAYMSPEQAMGEPLVDARTDVYSLGCVLYEMLAGEQPFTGPSTRAVIAKRLAEPVPHLRTVRDVPMAVEQVVMRALARAPADRFASAGEFADALAASIRPGGADTYAPPTARLGRRGWSIALSLAAAALIAAGYLAARERFAGPGPVAGSPKRLVVLPFENLGNSEDEYFADGMTEEITTRLTSTSGLRVIARGSAREYKKTEKPIGEIARELGVQYVLRGTVRWEKVPDGSSHVRVSPELIQVSDNSALWADKYEGALAGVFEVQSEIAEKVTRALGVVLLAPASRSATTPPTQSLRAYDSYLRGKTYLNRGRRPIDLDSAQLMLEQATAIDPRFALAYAWLSYVHAWQYWQMFDPSASRLARAKAAVQQAFQIDPGLPDAHLALGYYHYFGSFEYDQALAEFGQAQRTRPEDAELLFAIGQVKRAQGRWDEALAHLIKAEQLDPRSVEPTHVLGNTYFWLRRYADAERSFDRAILLSPSNIHFHADKAAVVLAWDGNRERARRVLHAIPPSADLAGLAAPPWPSLTERRVFLPLLTENQRSRLLAVTSDSTTPNAPALLLWKAALASFDRKPASERAYADSAARIIRPLLRARPNDWGLHGQLALAFLGLGQPNDALREAERAVAEVPPTKNDFSASEALWTLAEVEAQTGRDARAVEHLKTLLSRPGWLSVGWLRVDPVWDPLRGDASFRRLIEAETLRAKRVENR